MKVNVALSYVLFGCVVTLVTASLDWSGSSVDDDIDYAKRSLGDACRCCTTRREPWCCNACVFQFNSPTPFYTRKRTSDNIHFGQDRSNTGYPKRGRYRARSRCGCCFTRRLRWCCDSCSRSYWSDSRGKRSQTYSDELSSSPAESDLSRDTNVLDTLAQTEDAQTFKLHHRRRVPDIANNFLDIPPFHMDNMRQECLCCILYDVPFCCDRCRNTA